MLISEGLLNVHGFYQTLSMYLHKKKLKYECLFFRLPFLYIAYMAVSIFCALFRALRFLPTLPLPGGGMP